MKDFKTLLFVSILFLFTANAFADDPDSITVSYADYKELARQLAHCKDSLNFVRKKIIEKDSLIAHYENATQTGAIALKDLSHLKAKQEEIIKDYKELHRDIKKMINLTPSFQVETGVGTIWQENHLIPAAQIALYYDHIGSSLIGTPQSMGLLLHYRLGF